MKNINFDWSNFDSSFLKSIINSDKTNPEYRPVIPTDNIDILASSMNSVCRVPDAKFIGRYRQEIEDNFLMMNPEIVRKIAGESETKNYRTILKKFVKSTFSSSLADLYIKALYLVGSGEFTANQYSEFTNVRTVNLEESTAKEEISLYDFQKDAVDALKNHFLGNRKKSGLLVMPTGSGKTRTTVAFLLQNMVPKGYQIIWLTHRYELIDQSAESFYRFSPVISLFNKSIRQFKMVCVSGNHQTIKATEKDDNLMILSVQSVCRNLDFLDNVISDKAIIVVDEAHHTVAPSYRKIINRIRNIRPSAKLLGLTATPVRGNDRESKYLRELYDNNIVYSISMSTLITKGILADPVFENVDTGQDFEPIVSVDEKKFIKRWGELPPSLVDKVANSSARNEIIVNQYLQNKERYGKTIIFALNGLHAFTLCESLKKAGVACDFVYTGNSKQKNAEVISKFKRGKLDVLININIMSEGSDIPDIETVFLTRPTSSEVLLMQMIGRGMRGVSAGGTDKVTIVDFCDKWETFNRWLNPEWIISAQADEHEDKKYVATKKDLITLPWDMIRDIYNSISFRRGGGQANLAIPFGWYNLMYKNEDYKLIVFEDQYECYEKIVENRKELKHSGDISITALKKYYFSNFVICPSDKDLKIFVDNLFESDENPIFFRFEQRDEIEPYLVAQKIKEENLDVLKYPTLVYDSNPVAKYIFPSVEQYRQAVFDYINYGLSKPSGFIVEELPIELIPFKIDKPYNLKELYNEVVDEMFNGEYDGINSIDWTEKPMASYFGVCYYPDNDIRINVMLNSSQVPREAVKYIIYHEMLHRDYHGHDKLFRMKEHEYPDYTECERFLDFKIDEYSFEM